MTLKDKTSENRMPEVLPVLPLMSTVLFPQGIYTIQVGYDRNLKLLQDQIGLDIIIALTFTRATNIDQLTPEQLSTIGVATRIIKIEEYGEGAKQVTVEGIKRIRLGEFTQTEPYFVAKVEYLEDKSEDPEMEEELASKTMELVRQLVELVPAIRRSFIISWV